MTSNEMTDTGLSPEQEHELRALLHRAADGVEVTPPSTGVTASDLTDPGRSTTHTRGDTNRVGSRRWTIGAVAAAAAAAVLLAGGAWFVTGTDDAQQVATGGPDGSADVVPDASATSASAIWQWPEAIPDGLEVTRAMETTSAYSFLLAVDDPASPTRWLAISSIWWGFATGATDAPVANGTFEDGSTYAIYGARPGSTTGATWAELVRPGQLGFLTIAAVGVDHQAIIDLLAEVDARAVGDSTGDVMTRALFDSATQGMLLPEGLSLAGDPRDIAWLGAMASTPGAPGLAFVLGSPDQGDRIGVSTQRLDVAPVVASLELQVRLDGNNAGRGATEQTVTRRDDLSPGSLVVDAHGQTTLYLFTAEGTMLTIGDIASGRAGDTAPSVGLATLLDVARGLQVLPEADLRARLAGQGVNLDDASSAIDGRADAASSSPSSTAPPVPTTTG